MQGFRTDSREGDDEREFEVTIRATQGEWKRLYKLSYTHQGGGLDFVARPDSCDTEPRLLHVIQQAIPEFDFERWVSRGCP